jgi:hypothetical protein
MGKMAVSGGSGDVVGRFKAVQLASGSALAACPFLANQRSAFLETQLGRFSWFILVSYCPINFSKVAVYGSCPSAAAALARAGLKNPKIWLSSRSINFFTVRQKTGAA